MNTLSLRQSTTLLPESAPSRALFYILLMGCLCTFTLTGTAAGAEVDVDRIVFDAYPMPESGAAAAAPRFPAHNLELPPPIARRIAPQEEVGTLDLNAKPAQETVEEYLDIIAATQRETSPYDQALFEPYLSLGLGYQQLGDHEQAIIAFEQAEYISRINNGLYAPEQFPIIERMITSYVAQGEMAKASERRRYLYYLNSQQYGGNSLEVVPALTALADWNMAIFDRALRAGNNVGFVASNNNLNLWNGVQAGVTGQNPAVFQNQGVLRLGGSRSLTPRGLAMSDLYSARAQYYQAIYTLAQQRRFTPARLEQMVDLELRLLEATFLSAHPAGILEDPVFYMGTRVARTGSRLRRDELSSNSSSYKNGRAAYERMRIYQNANPTADAVEKAQPLLGLGDWHLLFNRRQDAVEQYQAAAQRLHEAGMAETQINALLEPAVPVQLPEFAAKPNSRRYFGITEDEPLDYDGWVDVRLRVSRYGTANHVVILGRSDNATREIERRLNRVLRNSPFRPSLSAALASAAQEFTLRYYFKQLSPSP